MAPTSMKYSELFDYVRISANEAADHDGEHAYYEVWNQILVHLGLLVRKGSNIRLGTGPQPCISRNIFSDDDGPVDLGDEISDADVPLTRDMDSRDPSAELHKLHVEFDQSLPSDLIPHDSLSELGAFDESINLTDNAISAKSSKESASTHLKVTTEKRFPDFLVFAYVLHDNSWTRYVLLIVEIKDLPFLVGADSATYKETIDTEMVGMYFQVRTQAQLVFHENPQQQFIRALCVVGLVWTMIEFTRDRLPPLPTCRIWDQDLTDIKREDEITLSTQVHGIFSDDAQTKYNSSLRSRFRETFTKFTKDVVDVL